MMSRSRSKPRLRCFITVLTAVALSLSGAVVHAGGETAEATPTPAVAETGSGCCGQASREGGVSTDGVETPRASTGALDACVDASHDGCPEGDCADIPCGCGCCKTMTSSGQLLAMVDTSPRFDLASAFPSHPVDMHLSSVGLGVPDRPPIA